jgi:hypothetical protein
MIMANWTDKLSEQLDKDQPNWFIAWADQRDLVDSLTYAKTFNKPVENQTKFLKERVSNRLFYRIMNSAITAGLVVEVDQKGE